jgi:hypothetical protein
MMTQSPYSQPRRARNIGRIVVVALLLAMGCFWVVAMMRRGRMVANPSGVAMINSTSPPDGAQDVPINTHVSALLNAGHSVDLNTLDGTTVRLYSESGQGPVAARVNTSAGGDEIVLIPTQPLEPSTRYAFEIKGVKDEQGTELMPFKMSFMTSQGRPTSQPGGMTSLLNTP